MLPLVAIPLVVRYSLSSFDMKEEPRSLCTYDGKPNIQNNVVKCEMTEAVVISRQGKAKGYRLNSSITNNMYWLHPSKGTTAGEPLLDPGIKPIASDHAGSIAYSW